MRIKTPIVKTGNLKVGGNNPIVIQSMTNTDTANAPATAKQCIELYNAGAQLVRITVDNKSSAQAVPEIRQILDQKGYSGLPLIGDFHFNGHILLSKFPDCAKTLDKYRINPGNVGRGTAHNKNFKTIIEIAKKYNKPVRIGGNIGSLDQEFFEKMMDMNAKKAHPLPQEEILIKILVESTFKSAKLAEKLGLPQNKIVLSVKMSDVPQTIKAYELLAKKMSSHPYAIHLGLTEAGSGMQGIVSSSTTLAILLNKGIGDTIRISLTPQKGHPRTEEIKVCKQLLQSLGYINFKPKIISCPGCGRTNNQLFQKLVTQINDEINKSLPKWLKKYPNIVNLKIAIMGCIVNGPGEALKADIALCLPGKTEKNTVQVYINGKFKKTLKPQNITKDFFIELLKEIN